MSTASALVTMGDRRIGLRATDYNAPSLHPNLKKEPPAARQPTPDEDICRPPEDSSNEESPDSEFGDPPPLKRRKTNGSDDSVAMESIPRHQPSKTLSSREQLPNAPSDIKGTVWKISQRNAVDVDEDFEEVFSLSQKSRRKKSINTYKRRASNIHTAELKPEKPKKTQASPAKTHQGARGFMTRDTTDIESKRMDPFSLILRRSMNESC